VLLAGSRAGGDTPHHSQAGAGHGCPHPEEGLIPRQPAGTAEMVRERRWADRPPTRTSCAG